MEHPDFMRVRLAVRRGLTQFRDAPAEPLVLVGLSGGADSLALAAALAAEGAAAGVRGGALVVDHGLQAQSATVAARAAEQARGLGLDPVLVRRVKVAEGSGPEAAAREARYRAFVEVASELGVAAILTAHTRDDQAEQVLLALTRGSGARSIAGIPHARPLAPGALLLRPLLAEEPGVTRSVTEGACRELGLEAWNDPHNSDPAYARVRVRETLLPALARELGPGVTAGLARSADLAREDADALDEWAGQAFAMLGADRGPAASDRAEVTIGPDRVAELLRLPAAVRQRVIHRLAREQFGSHLSREHARSIAALITHWRGQGPVFAPGMRVARDRGGLHFARHTGSPRQARDRQPNS